MALAKDYQSVMARSNEIQKEALGLDYKDFETSPIAFDYDALMKSTGYTLKTNPATLPVPLKTDVQHVLLLMQRNWDTKVLWQLLPATMVQQ